MFSTWWNSASCARVDVETAPVVGERATHDVGGLRLRGGERCLALRDLLPFGEEEPVAVRRGQRLEQVLLRHQQFALEDAVPERADEPETDRSVPGSNGEDALLAHRPLEHVGHRVLVPR